MNTEKEVVVDGITVLNRRNMEVGTSYQEFLIPFKKADGRQVRVKVCGTSPTSVLGDWNCTNVRNFGLRHDYLLVINAGIYIDPFSVEADGITIIDGKILKDITAELFLTELHVLGITAAGDFKTYFYESAENILADGCIYALTGFVPLIKDGLRVKPEALATCKHWDKRHPRQIVGRFFNGDYFTFCCDGRKENENGMTLQECADTILQDFGDEVAFAFNLDGGGSTQTMIGKRLMNPNVEGRPVPNVIAFE